MRKLSGHHLPGVTGLQRANPSFDSSRLVSQLPTLLIHLLEGTSASLLRSDFWNILLYDEPNTVVLELPLPGPGLPCRAPSGPGNKSAHPPSPHTHLSPAALGDSCHGQDLHPPPWSGDLPLNSGLSVNPSAITCYVPTIVLGTGQQWQILNQATSLPSWVHSLMKDFEKVLCSRGCNRMTSHVQEGRTDLQEEAASKLTLQG